MIKWLAALLGSVFTFKTFLSVMFMAILGIIFYNLMVEVIQESMNFALTKMGDAPGSVSAGSISGFSGWVAAQCKVPECISVIGSGVATKFILRKIPFIKW
jgi:hypothetical protein